jgi:hypothetical protein
MWPSYVHTYIHLSKEKRDKPFYSSYICWKTSTYGFTFNMILCVRGRGVDKCILPMVELFLRRTENFLHTHRRLRCCSIWSPFWRSRFFPLCCPSKNFRSCCRERFCRLRWIPQHVINYRCGKIYLNEFICQTRFEINQLINYFLINYLMLFLLNQLNPSRTYGFYFRSYTGLVRYSVSRCQSYDRYLQCHE